MAEVKARTRPNSFFFSLRLSAFSLSRVTESLRNATVAFTGRLGAVNRDEARPLEITEVRRQEDGQLNVFAREIMQ